MLSNKDEGINADLKISSLNNQGGQTPGRVIIKDQGRTNSLPVEVASSVGRKRNQPKNKHLRSDAHSSKSRGGLASKESGAVATAHFNPEGWASQQSQ